MPFQSEKQRRYLWANEPEIARDWTDTYGSRVRKQNGGIMQSILMQLAKTWGIPKAMEMLGMGKDSDEQTDQGYVGNLISNFNPMRSLTRFGINKALSGNLGSLGALGPIGAITGLAYLGNKHRLGLTGYTTQGGYEKARQDRINMQRQSNIIKTLQSKKYAPGWEKTAFERVQNLGKNLNLVDAGESSMNLKTPKKTRAPVHYPNVHAGEGEQRPGPSPRGGPPGGDPGWKGNRGGLAGLWPR